ncbi:serine/threonine protein kinase, variant [Blastomyces dermatitidis ER-3]|uniref:Serine/threonine protein kinase n=1 Tax=Ajellomyces dermatitidis (strain ER-3 / ATCC MYA-2586) TaxID=559297 RepID=A0ABX2VZ13_AJEDR|nr:serine/threonine protein kinase [Blastomyces dermatitidis ER-3]XP_045282105.1 serine/threonine protein kinase, variant [Blastomyces dermatitidis ER-3]OAT02377.1 serine/threonine protein kinase [Blastomyces dermatitidis ER-3]OAT02378.1 serine/threonine protein kinase, variant [Blastomyces dermatitidis ER-3]
MISRQLAARFKTPSTSRLSGRQFKSYNLCPGLTNTRSIMNSPSNTLNAPYIPKNVAGIDLKQNVGIPMKELEEPLQLGTKLVSQSGTQYQVDQILQCRTEPTLACVYLAISRNGKKYVMKNIFHTEFEYQLDLQTPLASCPNLRVVMDTIPEHLLFVYNYFTDDLLELAKKENLSDTERKRILRATLAGLADLHDQSILHGDIKPNNVFVDYDENPDGSIRINQVQIGDLEMGSMVPPGLNVRGARLGNPMWRSPESHAAARINRPSDIFSFGLVCIYTMLQKIIFRIDSEGLTEEEKERLVARRLLSHFGDSPGLVGLVEHLDYDAASWRDLVLDVIKEFSPKNPRKPFSMWEDVDECFRDLITKMTSLDPTRRITAREALEHPWFQDV